MAGGHRAAGSALSPQVLLQPLPGSGSPGRGGPPNLPHCLLLCPIVIKQPSGGRSAWLGRDRSPLMGCQGGCGPCLQAALPCGTCQCSDKKWFFFMHSPCPELLPTELGAGRESPCPESLEWRWGHRRGHNRPVQWVASRTQWDYGHHQVFCRQSDEDEPHGGISAVLSVQGGSWGDDGWVAVMHAAPGILPLHPSLGPRTQQQSRKGHRAHNSR